MSWTSIKWPILFQKYPIKQIIENLDNMDQLDANGDSLLWYMCMTGQPFEYIKYVVDRVHNIDVIGFNHTTPLRYACLYCSPDIIMYLIEHGANPYLVCGSGHIAIDALDMYNIVLAGKVRNYMNTGVFE